jgi:MFS family permease
MNSLGMAAPLANCAKSLRYRQTARATRADRRRRGRSAGGRIGLSYLGELRDNIRPLAAASLGSGTGMTLYGYATSIFAPHLIKVFGWSRAEFALVGLAMLAALLPLPFIGRFTDRFGVRRVALAGTLLLPLCFVALALQPGGFGYFLVCSAAVAVVGSMTSPLVYTRLIAANFVRAQGLALTVVNCTPAAIAVVFVPLLNHGIETIGWRQSYFAYGMFTLVCGLAALLLIPRRETPETAVPAPEAARPHTARADFSIILRSPIFWVIFAGLFLSVLGSPLYSSQMNVMLVEKGLTTQMAANIAAVFAFGTIVGRLACGLALDRFPTPYVSTASFILPALGFFLLATSLHAVPVIVGAMFLIGLSLGAENDLLSFLVARYFKLRIYSSTLSILFFATFLATSTGAGLISLTLKLTDSFAPYLFFVSGTVLVGSLLFLILPRSPDFEKIG